MKKIKIEINGMSCSSCERHVKEEFEKIGGVKSVKVSAKKKEVALEVEEKVSEKDLKNAVKEAGYEPGKVSLKGGLF